MRTGARLSGLALVASSLPGAAAAQEPTLEMRLVQAFQTYCMASAADAKRVKADLRVFYRGFTGGTLVSITKGLDLVIAEQPYSRVRILFEERPGTSTRTCRVDVTPAPDRQLVLATIERDLGLGAGASTVLPEVKPREGGSPRGPRPETELTLWKTLVDGTEAEIEFRAPASGTGPSLHLSVPVGAR